MPFSLEPGVEPVPGYRLVRRLGQGGFGEVWEATAPGGVGVALKFVRLDTDQAGPELRALEVIRNIRHPHLLDVQFAVQVEDRLIIAMPLCDRSLMDRLRECRDQGLPSLPRDELLGIMGELAQAIDFLNEPRHPSGDGGLIGVQHRDIKPQNVFLVGGSARLADFGLAKAFEASTAPHTGSLSPHYVAPEAIEGRVSRWTDQYSLAVTYCQLRTGRLPFTGDSIMQILNGHAHESPNLVALPAEERSVVARALAKNPEDRWPTCREFVHGLEEAVLVEDGRLAPTTTAVAASDHPGGKTTTVATKLAGTQRDGAGTEPGAGVGGQSGTAAVEGPRRRPRWIAVGVLGSAVGLAALAVMLLVPRSAPTSKAGPGTSPAAEESAAVVGKDTSRAVTRDEPERPPAHVPAAAPPTKPKPRLVALAPQPPDAADPVLAQQAHAVFKKFCYGCHGSTFKVPRYNVLDRDILVAPPTAGKKRKKAYVVPGKPDDSLLWQRVGIDEDMPPEDNPQPSDDERATLKRWIEAGAPFPVLEQPREFVGEKDVLTAIRDHLEKTPEADRPFRRYFTLTNLHNNRKVLDDDLRLYRAALAKVVNSLSWKPQVVVPQAVEKTHETVYAVDLRDLGWDVGDLWRVIVRNEEARKDAPFLGARDELRKGYPYGLTHNHDRDDEALQRVAADVYRLNRYELPYVRADWLVATASRPPLYDAVLGLPDNARALERRLDVDVAADFLRDRLARAGFATSGVSSHNRVVERHDAAYGSYWKSYDFKADEGAGEVPRFPLGPVFADNPFPHQAFEHAGGEIIFSLPNRLHGYLLVNNKDDRIEEGPIAIVADSLQTAGTAAIVAGLSCMGCHKVGMIGGFEDAIRGGNAVAGEAREKVERLYPVKGPMDKLLAGDEAEYLAALGKAIGPFLNAGSDQAQPLGDFPEPVGAVARLYVKDLDLEEAAAELGFQGPKELQAKIEGDPRLRELGLGPLLQPGGRIKRAAWESLQFLNSPFQEAALRLERGTPYHEL